MQFRCCIPTFRRTVLPPSSGLKWLHTRNNPENHQFYLHYRGNFQCHMKRSESIASSFRIAAVCAMFTGSASHERMRMTWPSQYSSSEISQPTLIKFNATRSAVKVAAIFPNTHCIDFLYKTGRERERERESDREKIELSV